MYNLIDNNLGISKAELAIRIGKSEKTVQRIVNSLIEKKVVIRIGSNKTGHWEVIK
ncbi:MAG: winged helix-turn-helix transcriptional regulator [Bacillales bacterium]|nr:winged helix-turn-helix transcriptional regulator [Bacillales bacterium]